MFCEATLRTIQKSQRKLASSGALSGLSLGGQCRFAIGWFGCRSRLMTWDHIRRATGRRRSSLLDTINPQTLTRNCIGENGTRHHTAMNFNLCRRWCFKHQPLTRKNDPFKVPIWNICNSRYLNLACGVDITAENDRVAIFWQGIKNLSHDIYVKRERRFERFLLLLFSLTLRDPSLL
jgi:hypothetical protein